MKNKIKIIIAVAIILAIGAFMFFSYKTKSIDDSRGTVIDKTKEVTYEVKDNYKNLEIKFKFTSKNEEGLKITIINPKKTEKVINAKTNEELIESFNGQKGEWILKFESNSNEPVDCELNYKLNNK
ncbi:MAG: hypothetical protein ACRDAU_16720 [Clostridium sp.]